MSAFFFQRINDHIQYLRRLELTLKDQGDFQGCDANTCKLGQWINTEVGSKAFDGGGKEEQIFAEMLVAHESFHKAGERALVAKSSNDPDAVKHAVTDMLKDSNVLVSKLMQLDQICTTSP